MKTGSAIALALVGVVGLTAGSLAYRYYTAEVRGIVDAEVRIESGQNRIQQYNRFFDLCAEIQTMQSSLEAQKSLLETSEGGEEERVRANIAGMTAQLNRYVNRYNADARKEYTAARFRDSSLPYQIDANSPINCTVNSTAQ